MRRGTTFLAPMLGASDNPGFLRLCKRYGCDVLVLPMVFTRGVSANPAYVTSKLASILDDRVMNGVDPRPLVVQLIGDVPPGDAGIHHVFDVLSSFDIAGVNYNLGCPSVKVRRLGLGATLMCYPERRDEIIEALVASSPVPVSVKVRLLGKGGGIEPDVPATINACRFLAGAGVAWIAVHGRTMARGYGGMADWSAIKAIHEALPVPIVGNGDISSAARGHELVDSGYAIGFMIGRAAMHDPRVFDRTASATSITTRKTWQDVAALYRELVATCESFGPMELQEARTWAMRFSKGVPGGKQGRARIGRCTSAGEIGNLLDGS